MVQPKLILLFSGKRKSGKDFLTEILQKKFGAELSEIIRISSPIKEFWAKEKSLDLDGLLSDGPYKEQYRKEMIDWSDGVRQKDYGFFCREAMSKVGKRVVIVSDVRRKNDIKWFSDTYGRDTVKIIRIVADNEVRVARGWRHEKGVDDVQSECDLDDFQNWDYVIDNNTENSGVEALNEILDYVEAHVLNG